MYNVHVHNTCTCHCVQVLSAEDYAEWVELRREAEVSLEDRDNQLFTSARMIESQLELLGMKYTCRLP